MKIVAKISFVTMAGLLVALIWVEHPERWPALEHPARQGEALDILALQHAQFVHSGQASGRLVREPQNTWSNLAFVLAGAVLVSRASTGSVRLIGAALVAVGIGSFLYHASASRALRHLDVGAMNGLFFTTTVFVTTRYSDRFRARVESYIWVVAVAALGFAVIATLARNFVLFGVKPLALTTVTAGAATVLIGALILEARRRRSIRVVVHVAAAIALFFLAVICQIGDRPGGWLLSPDSPVQAHALWHVLSALALFIAVRALDLPATTTTNLEREEPGKRAPRTHFARC